MAEYAGKGRRPEGEQLLAVKIRMPYANDQNKPLDS
jgi:hypothetical protein